MAQGTAGHTKPRFCTVRWLMQGKVNVRSGQEATHLTVLMSSTAKS